MGLWKPTPKDIFKSRWKRFYKRCYRPRTAGNAVDRPPPHEQGAWNSDGVPSPWRLHYSLTNFQFKPPDLQRSGFKAYTSNLERYMLPSVRCSMPTARDLVLRCLDRGQHWACDSGHGRAEVSKWRPSSSSTSESQAATPAHVPTHIYNAMVSEAAAEAGQSAAAQDFLEVLKIESHSETFVVRRLYELCEEWELVWEGGQNDPRKPQQRRSLLGDAPAIDRGRFPFVDEQASLMDELSLREILRLSHRTKSRRHPKWRETAYWYKKCHRQYLRRKAMNEDEVKQRMGLLKGGLSDA